MTLLSARCFASEPAFSDKPLRLVPFAPGMAPARTPPAVVQKLRREIAAIAQAPDGRQTFVTQGSDVVANTPEASARVIRTDYDKWGEIGRKLGVSLD